MKTFVPFIVDPDAVARGYKPGRARFLMTFNRTAYAQIDAIAKELGIDIISFCRAAVARTITEYKAGPKPFLDAVAAVKMRAAEALTRDADDLARRAENAGNGGE